MVSINLLQFAPLLMAALTLAAVRMIPKALPVRVRGRGRR